MKTLGDTLEHAIWSPNLSELPALRAWPLRVLRVGHALANDLLEGQLTLRAMSLVYTTLLSLVPLLALSFSVLKGFGVHNQIEPLLLRVLTPLGERAPELTSSIIGFVDNMRVGVLGSLGLAFLMFTVVSLIQKIERAFNYAWRTSQGRSLGQRFSNYLSVIMVGPVLIFAALGLTASLSSAALVQRVTQVEVVGWLVQGIGQLLPYLLVIAAFTFVYVFVPNAKVKPGPAAVGGLVAGTLWQSLGFGFAAVVATSARYTAIYSGFAVLVFFMMWLYLSWLILLAGARLAFYVQFPEQITSHPSERLLSSRRKEHLALLAMTRIAQAHFGEEPPPTSQELARSCGVAADLVEGVLDPLERTGFVVQAARGDRAYVPARAPERVLVEDILRAVRTAEESGRGDWRPKSSPAVDEALASFERALSDGLQQRTLRDVALAGQVREARAAG